jgi:DNA-binding transcriptional MerR regulator
LKIGALAALTRTSAPTVRYYETIGLLPLAARRDSGQRTYGDADVQRLTFIRRFREFGVPIKQVQSLVALVQDRDRPCVEARDLAQQHLDALRAKRLELEALEGRLAGFIQSCDASRANDPGLNCETWREYGERTAGDALTARQ